jgi:putative pyruvate formate lyase activating enzyme
LVDLKFFDQNYSQKYCKAKNYFEVASSAVLEMVRQKPVTKIENGIMKQGVIVRHLVMPTLSSDSKKILQWVAGNVKKNVLLSLMCQYTPYFKASEYPEINRKITPLEYKIVLNEAIKLGLENGFSQELESAQEKFIPLWDLKGV